MRVYANQVAQHLAKGIHAFYLVMGDEPFQVQQTIEQIKTTAHQHGFAETIKFVYSPQFDWQEIMQEYASLSLFSQQKIIELDLADSKPNASASKLIVELASNPNPDVIFILRGQKNGSDIQRSTWFKALDKHGLFVPCYQLTGRHLSQWLNTQCNDKNLRLTPDAKALLLDANQGNLFAVYQELEKISLIFSNTEVDVHKLAPTLLNQSKFDIFDLSDALLAGNGNRICDIMHKLQQENSEPTVISWAINKEAQTLYQLSNAVHSGIAINDALNQAKVWKNKLSITQSALQRLNHTQTSSIINALAKFDAQYKQHTITSPYQVLMHIALMFVGQVNFELPLFKDAL